MSAIRWCSVAVLACGALAACDAIFGKELNPKFCAAHPADQQCLGDAAMSCSSSAECPTPLVCDVGGTNTCVACTQQEAAACTGATPVCSDDHTCRGCAAHAECAGSDACLPDGSCADPGQVAYVKPLALGGTDNPSCTLAMPCTKVASALQTGRPYVKLAGANDEGGTISIDNRNVTLLAERDAKLIRTSNGLHVEVKGTSQVEIYDLEISGASGAQGVGISMPTGNTAKLTLRRVKILNNAGGGISATGGTLTVSQSTLSENAGGGISVSGGEFDLVNNIIAKNGGVSSVFGGIRVDGIVGPGTRRIDFNTITANNGPMGAPIGISCTAVTQPLTFSNNIIYENQVGGGRSQVGGSNCSWTYSDIGPDTISGTGNINMDPMFVNAGLDDYHLAPGSPAKDAADRMATLDRDIDGDPRPQGDARDMGADEIR